MVQTPPSLKGEKRNLILNNTGNCAGPQDNHITVDCELHEDRNLVVLASKLHVHLYLVVMS